MLSMKFPHLFLQPEIIITFLWGWEWSGGQVQHRSPRNSGYNFYGIFKDHAAVNANRLFLCMAFDMW